jgi:hypothetical protein
VIKQSVNPQGYICAKSLWRLNCHQAGTCDYNELWNREMDFSDERVPTESLNQGSIYDNCCVSHERCLLCPLSFEHLEPKINMKRYLLLGTSDIVICLLFSSYCMVSFFFVLRILAAAHNKALRFLFIYGKVSF